MRHQPGLAVVFELALMGTSKLAVECSLPSEPSCDDVDKIMLVFVFSQAGCQTLILNAANPL